MADEARTTCLAGFTGATSLSCLTVKADEDGESYSCSIQRAADYATDEPAPIFTVNERVDTFWMSPSETYYATTTRGALIHGRGAKFEQSQLRPMLTNLWGLGDGCIYALGKEGLVLHFDGKAWSEMSIPGGGYLYAISGTSPERLYVVADRGKLFHYDGARWQPIDVGAKTDLYAVDATQRTGSTSQAVMGSPRR